MNDRKIVLARNSFRGCKVRFESKYESGLVKCENEAKVQEKKLSLKVRDGVFSNLNFKGLDSLPPWSDTSHVQWVKIHSSMSIDNIHESK